MNLDCVFSKDDVNGYPRCKQCTMYQVCKDLITCDSLNHCVEMLLCSKLVNEIIDSLSFSLPLIKKKISYLNHLNCTDLNGRHDTKLESHWQISLTYEAGEGRTWLEIFSHKRKQRPGFEAMATKISKQLSTKENIPGSPAHKLSK